MRARNRGLDLAEVDVNDFGVARDRLWIKPQLLFLAVGFHERDLSFRAAGGAQVLQRALIHWEKAARSAVFGRHVGHHSALAAGQSRHPGPEKLDELSRQSHFAQPLGHGQRKIRGQRAVGQGARHPDADDLRDLQHHRHPEHHTFSLEPSNTPGQYTDAVDHGCMAVSADQRVRVSPTIPVNDHGRQPLEIQRVHDPRAGRMNTQTVQRVSCPLQQPVTLRVALDLLRHVLLESVRNAEVVDGDGMVNRHVDRQCRIER